MGLKRKVLHTENKQNRKTEHLTLVLDLHY